MAIVRDMMGEERVSPQPSPERKDIPTAMVAKLRRQGLTNNQIIQILQREGFSLHLINTAIGMVDAKESVHPFAIPGGTMQQDPFGMPENPSQTNSQQILPMQEAPAMSEERIQEIAEAIIDEKWNELVQNVSKVVEWKNSIENKVNKIEQQITDLKEQYGQLQGGVLERLGSYDKGMREVGTEIKALEKVFQKILPGFVDNVQELSHITKNMRRMVPPKR